MTDIVLPERTESIFTVKPAVSLKNVFSGITMPQNPGIAENNFYGAHQDSYSSESVSLTGPTGKRLKRIVQRNPYGLAATMATNASGQLISLCLDTPGVYSLITFEEDCTITTATPVSTHRIISPGGNVDFAGGYFYMDNDNNSIVAVESRLKCFPTARVEKKPEVYQLDPLWISEDVVELVTGNATGNSLYTAMPVWDKSHPNRYWCLLAGSYDQQCAALKSPAYIAVVDVRPQQQGRAQRRDRAGSGDPAPSATKLLASMKCPTGWNNNTFSVSEKGAFFLTNDVNPTTGVCDKGYLWAVSYDSTRCRIHLRWKYAYENCGLLKTGLTNIGSGTTPTVTQTADGKTLVAIVDNANPQMHVVVVNDADGSLVTKVPVFPKMRGCDEASLIGVQDRIVVENNFGHTVSATQSQLVANEPGFAMIQLPASASGASDVVWEDKHNTIFGMSMLARESGIIFAFTGDWGDPESATKGGEYFVTAMDSWDGRVIWRIPVGRGRPYTHEYGGLYFNRKGDKIYVGTNRFLVSVQDIGSSED